MSTIQHVPYYIGADALLSGRNSNELKVNILDRNIVDELAQGFGQPAPQTGAASLILHGDPRHHFVTLNVGRSFSQTKRLTEMKADKALLPLTIVYQSFRNAFEQLSAAYRKALSAFPETWQNLSPVIL